MRGADDELKALGDTFDALLARLEASFTAQRQFIANASHELRTPLARQRVISQVALADPAPPPNPSAPPTSVSWRPAPSSSNSSTRCSPWPKARRA